MASTGKSGGTADAGATVHADASSLASAAVADGGHHVAVITRGTVDEWHRHLASAGALPPHRHLVSVDHTVRSAAASGPRTRPLGEETYVSTVERPLPPDFPDFLTAALADAGDAGGSLVVDDPSVLTQADTSLDWLSDAATDAGVTLRLGVPDAEADAAALWRRFRPSDEAAERRLASAAVDHLRETDPTNFGYLRRHWREARRGVEAVEMAYPQAKQVHAAIPDPETTPRTLGATLQAFVKLGALGVWGETVAANRYDLTDYDPERVAAVGEVLVD